MAFSEEFLKKVQTASLSVNQQQAALVDLIENRAAPLLYSRQGTARKIQQGVQPEDEHLYEQQLNRANLELAKLLGLL